MKSVEGAFKFALEAFNNALTAYEENPDDPYEQFGILAEIGGESGIVVIHKKERSLYRYAEYEYVGDKTMLLQRAEDFWTPNCMRVLQGIFEYLDDQWEARKIPNGGGLVELNEYIEPWEIAIIEQGIQAYLGIRISLYREEDYDLSFLYMTVVAEDYSKLEEIEKAHGLKGGNQD